MPFQGMDFTLFCSFSFCFEALLGKIEFQLTGGIEFFMS